MLDAKGKTVTDVKPDQQAKGQGTTKPVYAQAVAVDAMKDKAASETTDSAASRSGAKRKRKSRGKRRNEPSSTGTRKRGRKPYPVVAFADVLPLADGIMTHNGGQPVVRETLLKKMRLEPNAQSTRNLITNSNKYGVTDGSHTATTLKLTPKGLLAINPKTNPIEQKKARFELAIGDVAEFNDVFKKREGNNMPAPEMLHDDLAALDAGDRKACADVFTSNVKFLEMLVDRDGAQYLMTLDEWLGQKGASPAGIGSAPVGTFVDGTPSPSNDAAVDFDKICFVISTIKDEGSAQRKHADMILNQYIDRALVGTGLEAVRADKIGDPGMISKQIIEYVLKSKLVVADLSFHNPNVFYELALRHVTGKPIVHLTRTEDRPPFDVGNFRAIGIDTGSVETAVMQLDTLRAEIATAIRKTIANGESRDNPILIYCPNARFSF